MHLITYENAADDPGNPHVGALSGSDIVDLPFDDMLTFLRGGPEAVNQARSALARKETCLPADSVRILPPILRPNSMRLFSLGEEHLLNAIAQFKAGAVPGAKEMALPAIPAEWYEMPGHYKGNVDEVYGPGATVPWPAYTAKLDFELEIAAVIGTTGRRIPVEHATSYIAGYTLLNDWSARDIQQREMKINLGPGICKDFAYAIGPSLATPDEFDRTAARLEVRVDGETWGTSKLEMQFSFEEVIAWLSQEQTLHPGDILTSGTVARGAGVELDRWVEEGSTVELEAEGIGVLQNVVGRRGESVPLPPSQRANTARHS